MSRQDPDDGVTTLHDHRVTRARLPTLTSLRFFAAALVVIVHLQTIWPAAEWLQRGQIGVSFFYLLSGFILSWAPSVTDTTARFYRRRVARIVPVHLLTWVIAVALVAPVTGRHDPVLGVVLCLFLLQAWVPSGTVAFSANGVAWSLSVEAFFYALFPLLNQRIARIRTSALWMLAAVMIVLVVAFPLLAPTVNSAYIFPIARLPEFIIGIVLSLLVQRGWRPRIGLLPAAALATAATAIVFLPVLPDRFAVSAVTIIPFALLIAAAVDADARSTSKVAGKWWVRLGEWSFALFMTHQIVLRLYVAFTPAALLPWLVVPALMVCVGVAAVVFRFIERPAERRLRGPQGRAQRLSFTTE